MLDVTDATKQAYQDYSSHKDLTIVIYKDNNTITLTNDDIIAQSLSLQERIEINENLSFTGCLSSVLRFKCADIQTDIKNAQITVIMQANGTEYVPLFSGRIDNISNSSHEQATMDIIAYDILHTLMDVDIKEWYDSLTFPMTLKQFRDALFSYLYTRYGLQQENVDLPNDSMMVYKAIEGDTIKCINVLKPICQINARYGIVGRNGKFKYINFQEGLYPSLTLYPSNNIYPGINNIPDLIDKSFYTSVDFENFTTQAITGVNLRGKDDRLLVSAGTSGNVWTINTNPLIWGYEDSTELQEVADNLLAEVNAIEYIPLKQLELAGLPYIECGDYISVETKRSVIRVYLLERTLTGIQALKDSYMANGIEKYPIYKPNIQQQAEIVSNQMESVVHEMSEVSESVSEMGETVNNLETEKQDVLTQGTGIIINEQNVISVTNPIILSTTDLTPGVDALPTGYLYFVYEQA